jgi:hypothetical protein
MSAGDNRRFEFFVGATRELFARGHAPRQGAVLQGPVFIDIKAYLHPILRY